MLAAVKMFPRPVVLAEGKKERAGVKRWSGDKRGCRRKPWEIDSLVTGSVETKTSRATRLKQSVRATVETSIQGERKESR